VIRRPARHTSRHIAGAPLLTGIIRREVVDPERWGPPAPAPAAAPCRGGARSAAVPDLPGVPHPDRTAAAALALEALASPSCWLDGTGTVVGTNGSFREAFGDLTGERIGTTDLAGMAPSALAVTSPGPPDTAEVTIEVDDQHYACSLGRFDDERCLCVLTRVAELPTARTTHLESEAGKFRVLADNAPAGILCSDVGTRVSFVNERCAEVFGSDAGELLGFGWLDQMADDHSASAAMDAVTLAVEESGVSDVQLVIARPDGTNRLVRARFAPISGGGDVGFVATVEDITEAAELASQLERHSTTDTLTGLANRRTLQETLEAKLASDRAPALLFLDLDNFKTVNDTLGHQAGDELLKVVAERLSRTVRGDDLVARLGGDEFVVLLCGEDSVRNAEAIAERVVHDVSRPFRLGGREINYVSASVGVVIVDDGRDAEAVLADADIAMYEAKKGGKNRSVIYDVSARQATERRQAVIDLLKATVASERDRVIVRYQPICDAGGRVTDFEALCRLRDVDGSELPPYEFIPLAEEVGVITELGAVIREVVMSQLAAWRAEGHEVSASVNLSPVELAQPDLAEEVIDELHRHGLPASALCLEVTETGVMADVDMSQRLLSELSERGVGLSIDDFGTGHSSLAYLKWLPAERLKIDRSFVSGVADSAQDQAILSAILALANSLGLQVVAEGVETEEQRDFLVGAGVERLQGWLFAKALDPEAATEMLVGAADPVPAT
jgi:diguanylate cyclase (GGDEF)-like protein/PAS domain S-box-containing protein